MGIRVIDWESPGVGGVTTLEEMGFTEELWDSLTEEQKEKIVWQFVWTKLFRFNRVWTEGVREEEYPWAITPKEEQ